MRRARPTRISPVILVSCLIGALSLPAVALGDGGQTIAAATSATYGQQEFGNTANGGQGQPGCASSTGHTYRSWWALKVTAGDAVTVDWGTQSPTMYMNLFPVGTTDYNLGNANAVQQENVNSNYTNEATYTATQDGVLPLEFFSDTGCDDHTAPYYFTASVLHGVVLALPTLTKLAQTGTIAVGVHNPDGAPINDATLTVSLLIEGSDQSTYATIGSGTASNGIATVAYTVPVALAGHSATIEASSSGAAYVGATSPTESVTVLRPPPCLVPTSAGRSSLATVEAQIVAAHCSVGTVSDAHSKTVAAGDVIKLDPKPDTRLANGARVSILVSSGPRHKHHKHKRKH